MLDIFKFCLELSHNSCLWFKSVFCVWVVLTCFASRTLPQIVHGLRSGEWASHRVRQIIRSLLAVGTASKSVLAVRAVAPYFWKGSVSFLIITQIKKKSVKICPMYFFRFCDARKEDQSDYSCITDISSNSHVTANSYNNLFLSPNQYLLFLISTLSFNGTSSSSLK